MEAIPGNPIIKHKFTADPTVLVHDGVVYLYTGHDEAPIGTEAYVMKDWLCFSSVDLVTWTEHPVPLRAVDFAWASGDAYASKVVARNGRFYWYAAVSHAEIPGKAIGVAVADSPTGPFRDAKGSALITSAISGTRDLEKGDIDPTVLIDDDGAATIFWGSTKCRYAKLRDTMIELEGEIGDLDLPEFSEGAHAHKRGEWYYLAYGYQMPEKVAYAMSRRATGPWRFMGILNELAGNCETNRAAIIDFRGNSYFFYHNGGLPNGGSHRRSVCVDRLFYEPDGTMRRVVMTSEGVR
jgi:beta-xylosidase